MGSARIKSFLVKSVEGLFFLEMSPRYARRAYDDTTVVQVAHRTTGGSVSVLFERDDFATFARWLADPGENRWVFVSGQTTAVFEKGDFRYEYLKTEVVSPQGLRVEIRWNSSGGRSVSALLSSDGRSALLEWVADKDSNGWEGWKSGR